jgi:sorbitol-specific phosphotransferase system component IIC
MNTKIKTIGDMNVWITTDEIRTYNKDRILEDTGQYICYFSLTDPTGISYGQIITEKKKPVVFNSQDEANNYVESLMANK